MALRERLLQTDLGDLWLLEYPDGRRALVRLFDSTQIDYRFREAVERLAGRLQNTPRVLPIVNFNWQGQYYFIEYRLPNDAPGHVQSPVVETLPSLFARLTWLHRVQFVSELFTISDGWRHLGVSPIGLHAGRVVACRIAGRWLAHLAPCPPMPVRSPYHVREAHRDVLVAVAPERLRGTAFSGNGAWEDTYAAATLVLQAISAVTPRLKGVYGVSDDDVSAERVEQQARGLLAKTEFTKVAIEPQLLRVPRAARDLDRLQKAIEVCTAFVPEARPQKLAPLREACRALREYADPLNVVQELEEEGRAADAIQLLDWARSCLPPSAALHREGARLARQLSLDRLEREHIDGLLKLEPDDLTARHRKMELIFTEYVSTPAGPGPDPQSEMLLRELKFFLASSYHPLGEEVAVEDWLRSAHIHARRREFVEHASDLGDAAKLRPTDLDILCRFGMSLERLRGRNGAERDREINAKLDALNKNAQWVIHQKQKAEILDADDAQTWTELFQSLLLPSP